MTIHEWAIKLVEYMPVGIGEKIRTDPDYPKFKKLILAVINREKSHYSNYTYHAIGDALSVLSKFEDSQKAINLIEANANMLYIIGWLSKDNIHIDYITEAQKQFGPIIDGRDLLKAAQRLYKQKIARMVYEELGNIIEDEENNREDDKEMIYF